MNTNPHLNKFRWGFLFVDFMAAVFNLILQFLTYL